MRWIRKLFNKQTSAELFLDRGLLLSKLDKKARHLQDQRAKIKQELLDITEQREMLREQMKSFKV